MRRVLDFTEILDVLKFENLAADYFREMKGARNVTEVDVKPPNEGGDGGRDILVTFRISDSIQSFDRRWVGRSNTAVAMAMMAETTITKTPIITPPAICWTDRGQAFDSGDSSIEKLGV